MIVDSCSVIFRIEERSRKRYSKARNERRGVRMYVYYGVRKFVRLGFMGAKSATVAGGEGKDN